MRFADTISHEGNITSSVLTGSVKSSPDSATELVTFTIGSASFNDGFTTWAVSLTPAQTRALPSDSDGDGRVDLVYDFVLAGSGGTNPTRLHGGIFTVVGFVTETA
jgi:hypothetical protein